MRLLLPDRLNRPYVHGDLPGPRSAELLARQDHRESNARVYPRHFPIAGELASQIQTRALGRGLIVELGGRDDCVVRMLPPLNVTAEVVDTACTILLDALEECCPSPPTSPASLQLIS